MNLENKILAKKSSATLGDFKERIFGDSPTKCQTYQGHFPPRSLAARSLMKYTVLPPKNGVWVVTITTNQVSKHDGKCMKAFPCKSEEEALATGEAFAPPKMRHKIDDSKFRCTICLAKFAVLRRSHNCRNCGCCICSACSITWPCKMLPDTYNFKEESNVRVCSSCEWLKESFRRALLEGKFNDALSLYKTGNVNLRCTFANAKGEVISLCSSKW